MKTIGDRIKEKRKELNLTQLQLAEKLNVTDRAVSKWEQGEGNPDISLLPELAKIFDVSIDYLLTGKEVEEKIVTISKLELCCKNDDVSLFNDLKNYIDEEGKNIDEYIERYDAIQVLKAWINKTGVMEKHINLTQNKIRLMLKYDLYDELVKYEVLDYPFEKGIRPERVVLPSIYFEWGTTNMYSFFYRNWPKSERIVKRFFSLHLNTKVENPNYISPYKTVFELAIRDENKERIKQIWKYVKESNDYSLEKCKDGFHKLNYNYDHDGGKQYYIVAPSKKAIMVALQLGLIDEAKEMNNYSLEKVEDNQFTKYEILSTGNKTKTDTRIFDVTIGEIVVLSRLLDTNDPEFIIKTLKNYPICYGEYIVDCLVNNKEKELIQLLDKYSIKDMSSCVLQNTIYTRVELYREIGKLLSHYSIIGTGNSYSSFPVYNGVFKKLVEIDKINGYPYYYDNSKINKQSFRLDLDVNGYENCTAEELEECGVSMKEFEDLVNKFFEKLKGYTNLIKEAKQVLIEKYEAQLKVKELFSKNYTKEFLTNEIVKGNSETVIIKLCAYFEAKLRAAGYVGDLKEMLGSFCGRYYGDDGWGYIVSHDPHSEDILNRLRMQRNNIVHGETKDMKPLTDKELAECINIIFDWDGSR